MQELDIKKIWKKLKKYPNVVGFDATLRPKIQNGKELNTMALRVYVKRKQALCALKAKEVIPKEIDGIPTDVVEIGEVKSLEARAEQADPKLRYRPYIAGTSACHKDCTACTSTAFFRDKETKQILFGLNNHCGALENKAKVGDYWVQPGPYDGGVHPQDDVAQLYRIVEIKFSEFECPYRNALHRLYRKITGDVFNKVDICFATPLVEYKIDVLNITGMFKGVREPEIGEQVQKMGRTTGYTVGTVESLSWTGEVQYSRGIALFTDCIVIKGTNFSGGGDSSSPVFDMKGNLIGILFAGSDEYTILCKIKNIEEEGRVEVVCNEA